MSLATPEKIRKLQRTFYAKAKEQPSYRFHQLYDKIYREDILAFAYQRCKANARAAGVDGQSFEMIEEYGRDRWLGELTERLRNKGYRPEAIRRVFLMADGVKGKVRYFGLPSGYEFSVLLGSLVDVSKAEADLTEDTIQVLNALDKDLHFQVFVTPT